MILISPFHEREKIISEGVIGKLSPFWCKVVLCSSVLVMLSVALCSGQEAEIESVIPAYSAAYAVTRDIFRIWDEVKISSSWQSFLSSDEFAGIRDMRAVKDHLESLLGIDLRTLAEAFGHRIALVQIHVNAGSMGPPVVIGDVGDSEDVNEVVWKVEQSLSQSEELEVQPQAGTYQAVSFGLVRSTSTDFTIRYAFMDNLFVLAFEEDAFEAVADVYLGEEPSLLHDPGFNSIRSEFSDGDEVFVYMNLELLWPMASVMWDPEFKALLQILGAREIRALAWTTNLLDPAKDQQLYMYMSDSRGLMSSLFANPKPLLAPHLIPAVDADIFLAAHLGDPEAIWEKIMDAVRSVMGDEDYSYMQSEISEFEQATALNLRDDLLSSVTGEVGFAGPVTAVMRFAEGTRYLLEDGLVMFCGVDDRERCAMSIERIFPFAGVQLQLTEYRGVIIYYMPSLRSPTLPLGYMFAGDLLVFGNLQKLEAIINEEPPLMVSEGFARLSSQLPQYPGLLYYIDLGKVGEMLLEASGGTQPEDYMSHLQSLGSIGGALVHDEKGLKARSVGTSGKGWLETIGVLMELLTRVSF